MSSFADTVELERALLKQLLGSVVMVRLYMARLRTEFFTSELRVFIFGLMDSVFRTSRSVLTDTVFKYEVESRVPDEAKRAYYLGEWDIVQSNTATDGPEILIAKLEEAALGRDALTATEKAVTLLTEGDITGAVAHMKRSAMNLRNKADSRPLVELTDFEARKKLIEDKKANPDKYAGIKTGFAPLDIRTGGLFPGELTLLAGITGVGKSTMVKQIERNIVVMNPEKNVLHIANEEYLEQVAHKFDASFVEVPYLDFKKATISDEDLERWQEYMRNWKHGRVFLKEVPAFTDVTLIEQAYRELENKGIPIHVIIIDHLPHVKPIQEVWNENDERAKAASDCKEIARSLRVPVIIPTQAATDVEEKQSKGKRAGKLDVYGSKGQVHVANTFAIITITGYDNSDTTIPEEERDVYWLVDVKKVRDGPTFAFRVKHIVRYGQVVVVAEGEKTDGSATVGKAIDSAEAAGDEATAKEKATSKSVPAAAEPEDADEKAEREAIKGEGGDTSFDVGSFGDEDKPSQSERDLAAEALGEKEVEKKPEPKPVVPAPSSEGLPASFLQKLRKNV